MLARVDLVRVNDPILGHADTLQPATIRSLDAIHLATAKALGDDVRQIVTYDERMRAGAEDLGFRVVAPS